MQFKHAPFIFLFLVASVIISAPLEAQQVADTLFNPNVGAPAFKEGAGPTVLIDEGHYNFHTMHGRYLSFARLLQKDGYVVRSCGGKFTRTDLDRAKILVISNALAKENEDDWNLPTPSAFDSAEIETLRNWVNDGGSLWLIADHMPFAGAAGLLAAEFGILMGNGFALNGETLDGRICFKRSAGTLAKDPIRTMTSAPSASFSTAPPPQGAKKAISRCYACYASIPAARLNKSSVLSPRDS